MKIYDAETGSLIAYDEAGDRTGFRYSLVNVNDVEYTIEVLQETSRKLKGEIHMNYVGEYGVDEQKRDSISNIFEVLPSVEKLTNCYTV